MDTQNKCCGNCKHFKDEDVEGKGYCENFHGIFRCDEVCVDHDVIDNGWTEITPDNVDDIYNLAESRFVDVLDSRIMVVKGVNDWCWTLSTMSKMGGYYFFVLP
jgi:hypothetical protein